MYSVVRLFEGHRPAVSEDAEQARGRVECLARTAGFVTLLAIRGDDGSMVIVEIFETLDEMRMAQRAVGPDAPWSRSGSEPDAARTITGEIVFQRGL